MKKPKDAPTRRRGDAPNVSEFAKKRNLCLVFAHLFCIFAPSKVIMYGKEYSKQVCLAGGYHL